MTTTIKAIQTRYKGFHFRSRSEARFAVFCDHCGIQWQYEAEGFNLGEDGLYLPDFWIATAQCWVEIKPTNEGHDETKKWKALVNGNPGKGLIVFNSDFERPLFWMMSAGTTVILNERRCISREHVMDVIVARLHGNLTKVDSAVIAAKSARFEHGESGAT
jgi:hypothetical protein